MVGFFTQCSIAPPRMMVWLSKVNHTFDLARHAEVLAVHLIPTSEGEIARWFAEVAGDDIDKLARVPWTAGPRGVPLVDQLPDVIVGEVFACEDHADDGDGLDHVGFLLQPIRSDDDPSAESNGVTPALLRLSDVADFDPGHPAD